MTNWGTRRTKPPESSLIPVIRLFFYLAGSRSIVDLFWKIQVSDVSGFVKAVWARSIGTGQAR
jgi:hypothetical protein